MNKCKHMDKKCEYADRLGMCENLTATCAKSRTMSDLISRQAVDKIINDMLENDNLQASSSVWHGLHMIKQLPSAQPQQTCEYWDSESKFCTLCRPSAQPEPSQVARDIATIIENEKDMRVIASVQPTIDAVEVVRCRDCKWWDVDSDYIFCKYGRVPKDDWFCADGERRSNHETE